MRPAGDRGAIRRAVTLRCEAVSLDRCRLLGDRISDLSASGLLLPTDEPALENEIVLVHLLAGERPIVAEAHVARVVAGARRSDRGRALGLRFTRVQRRPLGALLRRLRGTPPPVPRRPVRPDYAATVRAIHAAEDTAAAQRGLRTDTR